MLICYLDESTACGESDPATCVAGYIATGKQWDIFRRAWNLMMKHYKVDLLHTVEIETEQARKHSVRYNGWSNETVKAFQSDIQGIIVGTGPRCRDGYSVIRLQFGHHFRPQETFW